MKTSGCWSLHSWEHPSNHRGLKWLAGEQILGKPSRILNSTFWTQVFTPYATTSSEPLLQIQRVSLLASHGPVTHNRLPTWRGRFRLSLILCFLSPSDAWRVTPLCFTPKPSTTRQKTASLKMQGVIFETMPRRVGDDYLECASLESCLCFGLLAWLAVKKHATRSIFSPMARKLSVVDANW